VHYKVLEASFDCSTLPELLLEHVFRDFTPGETRIPATTRDETESALLDLLAVGALDVFDSGGRLSVERAAEVVRADSSWTYEERGAEIEVVENERSIEFADAPPEESNPHEPG
jgi:hypothetical protein